MTLRSQVAGMYVTVSLHSAGLTASSRSYIEADRIPRGLVEEAEVTVVGTLGLAQPTTREGVTAAVEAGGGWHGPQYTSPSP